MTRSNWLRPAGRLLLAAATAISLIIVADRPLQPVERAEARVILSSTPSFTPTPTELPTPIPSPSASSSPTFESTPEPSASPTPSPSASAIATSSEETPTTSATTTFSPTPSLTLTAATATPRPAPPIVINEIAWAGTHASPHDEWIELHNPGSEAVNLAGWILSDGGDVRVALDGWISPSGFFLLERSDDCAVSNVAADQIYHGAMGNSGEILRLTSSSGTLVDIANAGGGAWPAGDAAARASMERIDPTPLSDRWRTSSGEPIFAVDCGGDPILGSPRHPNSLPAPSPSGTATPRPATATATAAAMPSEVPTSPGPLSLIINEVAWAGTRASSSDEWIEIYNPGPAQVNLAGWTLTDQGDIRVSLSGLLPARGFYLLERGDDATVADIPADMIYSGSLRNSGETLLLMDPTGSLIDSANLQGGSWPAGNAMGRASMERIGGRDRPENWGTFTGYHASGRDAQGNEIAGTPRSANSVFFPTPTPTAIPARVVINEVLVRPRHDWNADGWVDLGDEFIELLNLGPEPVNLTRWILDDLAGSGSKPFEIPEVGLMPGGYLVFFRSETGIALNDSGDRVRLLSRNGTTLDELHYYRVRAYNLSVGRLPDGSRRLYYDLWPTPARRNERFVETGVRSAPRGSPISAHDCPAGTSLHSPLRHLARTPALVRWLIANQFAFCREKLSLLSHP